MPLDLSIPDVLSTTKVIALVGWSPNALRPSHRVAQFLYAHGYHVIPVNPGHVGLRVLNETVRANLSEIDEPVDMVDIFRRSELVLPVVEEALERLPALRTVWMQLGVENADAAALAEAKGITVIQNRCPAIEIPRLRIMTPAGGY
jgi:predicted CoA-binding protein